MSKLERLQKIIAQSGYTSRRKAEQLILDKRVKVNGKLVTELGSKASSDDIISVDDKVINEESKVYYVINKPKDVLSSVSDDRNRKVVVDIIKDKRRIYPVGRLDYDTTGLLILTNDGDFTHAMIHPSFEIIKVYQVVVDGFITDTIKRKLETGIMLDGDKTLPAKVKILNYNKKTKHTELLISLREGKNRQVKRMFEANDRKVVKLHRKQFGNLKIDDLKVGEYRKLLKSEIDDLIMLAKKEQ